MSLEAFKKQAALRALKEVSSHMRLGLGTGSTTRHFIEALGETVRRGDLEGVVGVATSNESRRLAERRGVATEDLDERPLDLAVDGADEVDPRLDALKGLGGALTREKLVALAAKRFVLIADASKCVAHLGEKAPIPVEVVPFGWRATRAKLERLGLRPVLRLHAGEPFVSDNHNLILDCSATPPFDAPALAERLKATPGVVEHGLFLGMAEAAYLGSEDGVIELRRRVW